MSSKLIEHLTDYEDEAELRRANFGKTNKYTTGMDGLDQYLGHGFGNPHGYEIITVFGDTGVGKSTFVLNMIAKEMTMGTKIGLMVLEDDMPDVYNRLLQIIGKPGMAAIKQARNVDVLPAKMLEQPWTFEDILNWIEGKALDRNIELFVIDHINFVFDNAELAQGQKELAEQRKFMRNLNFICRRLNLTVILVSHTSKDKNAEGMDKMYGTTAIKQASTKVVGVEIGEGQQLVVKLYKSRFTMRQDGVWQLKRTGLKLEEFILAPKLKSLK